MKITSPEFEHNGIIPKKFACNGEDINPELDIKDIPEKAETLVLIMDDPDAPIGVWTHWVVFNIPVTNSISENSAPGTQAMTNSGKADYHGPCPPSGTHRYFFKVFAVDKTIDLQPACSRKDVENAMAGHIVDKAELIGLYSRD
jgi:Raf kinase inhibitor-like YbhB/YbcL family protein